MTTHHTPFVSNEIAHAVAYELYLYNLERVSNANDSQEIDVIHYILQNRAQKLSASALSLPRLSSITDEKAQAFVERFYFYFNNERPFGHRDLAKSDSKFVDEMLGFLNADSDLDYMPIVLQDDSSLKIYQIRRLYSREAL